MKALSANLIPRARRDAQRAATRIRRWAAVLCAVLLACGIGYMAMLNTVGVGADDTAQLLDRVAEDIAAAEGELKLAHAGLASASRMLDAVQEVRDHPDWSALLSSMTAMRGDNIVLGSLDLTPVDAKTGQPTVSRPARYALRLSGLARDHHAATTFSLMLEETGVFSRVTLTDTTTQSIGDKVVVAFGIECSLDESGGVR